MSNENKDYQVKKGEEGYFHFLIDRPQFDSTTGKKISVAHRHVIPPDEYRTNFRVQAKRLGIVVIDVYHVPDGGEKLLTEEHANLWAKRSGVKPPPPQDAPPADANPANTTKDEGSGVETVNETPVKD